MSPVRPLLVALASCVGLASVASPRPACVIAPDGIVTLASGEARVAARTAGESLALSAAAGQATLRLASVGGMAPESAVDVVAPDGRLERRRGNVVEWYLSVDDGIEQGFDVLAPVDDSDSLVIRQHAGTGVRILEEGRSALVFGDDGRPALRVTKLVVADSRGETLPARFESDGATLDIAIDVRGAAWPVRVDPLIAGPEWQVFGAQAGARLGRSVASPGDVDGDGWPDLVAGARGFDGAAGVDCGSARLYRGTDSGIESVDAWHPEGDAPGALFGAVVAGAGDVDGDGFDDVLVAEHGTFRVRLFRGSSAGLAPTASWTASSTQADALFGLAIAGAGDVDGDGFDDVIVGEPLWNGAAGDDVGRVVLFRGSASGLEIAPSWSVEGGQAHARLGQAVAGGADVDGDGFDDVVAGAPLHDGADDDVGRVVLFAGGASGPSRAPAWDVVGDQAGAWLGSAVTLPGDLDGDGFGEIVAGEPGHDAFVGDEGRVLAWSGRTGFPETTPTATWSGLPGDGAGASVAPGGDVNGDGLDDLAVGAPAANGWSGRAVALLGDAALVVEPTPFVEMAGGQGGSELGRSVSGLGDVDGDGFGDFAAGEWQKRGVAGDLEGCVRVVSGHRGKLYLRSSLPTDAALVIEHVGDVDGDGFGDVAIGAPSIARLQVFRGGAAGLEATPWGEWTFDSGFGRTVARAGDVDGDGFDDVLAGDGVGLGHHSMVRLFRGGRASSASASWSVSYDDEWNYSRVTVAGAGDVNGDGFGDIVVGDHLVDAGRGVLHVYFGSGNGLPVAASQTLVDSYAESLGQSVDGAGDVDGDGFDDVVASTDNGIRLYRGSPQGLAFHGTGVPASSDATALGAGDVNADGFADVVAWQPNGHADLYLGSAAGLVTTSRWSVEIPVMGWKTRPAAAGDLDGDGRTDVLFGIPERGEVVAYLGTPGGLGSSPAWTWGRGGAGTDVALGGDVDGDALADPVVLDFMRANAFLGKGGGRQVFQLVGGDRGIALRGGVPDGSPLRVRLPGAAGRMRRVETRIGRARDGAEPMPAQAGPWLPRGAAIEEVVDLPEAPERWIVQARTRQRGPLRVSSRWISLPGNALREADVVVPPNHPPECAFDLAFDLSAGPRIALTSMTTDRDGDMLSLRWSLRGCGAASLAEDTSLQATVTLEGCSGTCTVQLDATDGHAATTCERVVTWSVVEASAGPDRVITCSAPSVVLEGVASGPPGSTTRWEPADRVSDPSSLTTVPLGGGTFTLTVADAATGCTQSDEVVVTDARGGDFASADAAGPLTCQRTSTTLSVGVDAGHAFSVAWSPASAVSSPTEPITTTSSPGTYTAHVTDQATGCQVDLQVVVEDLALREPSDLVARPTAEPLTVEKDSFGNLVLRWEDGFETTWSVFRAPLAELRSTRRLAPRSIGQCRLDAPAAVVAMPPDDSSYLVASDCGGGRISTLGRDSLGGERPAPSPGCP